MFSATESRPAAAPSASQGSGKVLGLLFPQLARGFLRTRAPTFQERLQVFITKKLYPDGLAVRGNWVAIDYVTDALLRCGTMQRYELFVEPSLVGMAKNVIACGEQSRGERQVQVRSISDLLSGVDAYSFSAFLNPSGNFPQPLIVRNYLASKLYPVTILSHGFSLHSMLFEGFLRLLLEGTYPCDSIICTSRASRDAMSNILDHLGERFNREFHASIRYSGRLDVIPLCTDTEKFRPQEKGGLRKRMRIPKDALVLLYLGYISPLKAELLPLLRVFRDLTRDCRRRRLLLVIAGTGDSGYAQGLDSYIRSLSLSKQVRVLENLSDEEKVSLTAAADIFVSPGDSIQESFGLTPIEAMSCGVPQVVADWDGYRDTVSHGETGFLVPTYWTQADGDLRNSGHLLGWEFDHLALSQSVAVDLEKLYTYLKLLIEDDSLRRQMSLNSRKRAESLYSFAALSRRYESLWEELAEIASCHPPVARGVNFDQPRYFDCFKNHATSAVTDDCGLEVTPLGRRTTGEDLQPLLHSRMSLFKTVDTDLALSALDELRKASGSTLGECVRAAARSHAGIHPDYARRNVMWLMKHGFLRPAARGEGAAGD